jgi:hypothetical protein
MVAVVTLLLLCAWSVNAQTPTFVWDKAELTIAWSNAAAASVIKEANGVKLEQIGTAGVTSSGGYIDVNNSNANLVLNATGNDALTITTTDPITMIKMTYSANGATNTTNPYIGFNATPSAMGSAVAAVSSCVMDATGVTGTTGVEKTYVPTSGNKFAIIVRGKGCDATTSNGNTFRIMRIEVYTAPSGPAVAKTSGSNPASAMETVAMTPVVYTYSNVADDANVLADWYTDNTYNSTTSAPAGLTINKNTTAKTVTVSGTPTSAGTYYYKVAVNETGGNAIEGVINVSAYVTPAPQFTLTTGNNNQYPVKETAITNIVYTIANATGANTTGLPAGLAGVYDNGTYTISGTVAAEAATGVYNYTVTATPLVGYSGADVTATGKIVVKSPTAKQICYLVATATPSANDTKLYPMLMDHPNYIVNLRTAAGTAPAASVYDAYDLIILNEIVGGTNAEAVALKNVNKPILSLKAFTYTTGRWAWGVPDNGFAANSVITVKQPTHPVFNGITLDGGTLSLVDNASGNTVQVNDVTLLAGRSIVVASAPKATTGVMAVAVHDVPAVVRGVDNAKYILIPIADANYHRMNNNVLTMINNAIDYLLNGAQFQAPSLEITSMTHAGKNGQIDHVEGTVYIPVYVGTDLTAVIPQITLTGVGTSVTPATAQNFSNSKATPLIYTVSDMISTKQYAVTIEESTSAVNEVNAAGFVFDGRILRNMNHEMIRVYDTTGRMMTSSLNDIDMSQFGQGIYIIRSENKVLKIAITH